MDKTLYRKIYNDTFFKNGPLSILLNSNFFARKGLFKHISKNKEYIHGDVLDFGCGSKPYQDIFNYKNYVGVDTNGAHPHQKESVDVLYDGKQLPFQGQKFDTVFSSQVFEHVEDIDFSLDEIYRILRPGGGFIFHDAFCRSRA